MAITRIINPATINNTLTYPDKSGTVALLSDILPPSGGLQYWSEGLVPTNNGTYLKANDATKGIIFSAGMDNAANGALAIVINGSNNTASGASSVIGGDSNTGAGSNSGVLSGLSNTNTTLATNSVISGGNGNISNSPNTTVGGGKSCTAGANHATNGQYATVGGGNTCTASGTGATVAGGNFNTASSNYSFAMGSYALAYSVGMVAQSSGTFSGVGNAQHSRVVLRRQTTDALPATLSTNGSAAVGTNSVSLQNNSAVVFEAQIVCKQTGSQNAAAWVVKGVATKGTTAATIAVQVDVTNVLTNIGLTGVAVAISADTTYGAIIITATGLPSTNLRWVSSLSLTEVVYP